MVTTINELFLNKKLSESEGPGGQFEDQKQINRKHFMSYVLTRFSKFVHHVETR